jgi:hypothetical protein
MLNHNLFTANCYSLSDINGNVFYVGVTTMKLKTRLAAHLAEAKRSQQGNRKKCEIIRNLNFEILINLLEQREIEYLWRGRDVEAKWILFFLEKGVDLSNCNREKKVFKLSTDYNKIVNRWGRGSLVNRRYFKEYLKLTSSNFSNLLNYRGFTFSQRETIMRKLRKVELAMSSRSFYDFKDLLETISSFDNTQTSQMQETH